MKNLNQKINLKCFTVIATSLFLFSAIAKAECQVRAERTIISQTFNKVTDCRLMLPLQFNKNTPTTSFWSGGHKRVEKWTDIVKTDKYMVCVSSFSSWSSGYDLFAEWNSGSSSSLFKAEKLSSETLPETRYETIKFEVQNPPVSEISFWNAPLTDAEAKAEFEASLVRCQKDYVNPNDQF